MQKITRDGSSTLYSDQFEQHYHSVHGAVQESQHVFLDMGLAECQQTGPIRILEMGFGTGLNALMTAMQAPMPVYYLSLEAFPISPEQLTQLNYGKLLQVEELFDDIHAAAWNTAVAISPRFTLEKQLGMLEAFAGTSEIDLVYWDAFAPGAQPELWTEEVFRSVLGWMNPGGILTTYCAKGDVRRAMIAAGFEVEKVPGPPGKREMLRARRTE